jgi:tetratricopeptide (TPR) repeat protein
MNDHLQPEPVERLGTEVSVENRARILRESGDLEGAIALYQEQERCLREVGDMNGLQMNLGIQALVRKDSNDLAGALALLQEKETICRQLTENIGLLWSLNNQAQILQALKDLNGALAKFKEMEQICRQIGHLDGLRLSLSSSALILKQQNDLDGALSLYKEYELLSRQENKSDCLQWCLGEQALISMKRKDEDQAVDLLKRKEEICRETQNQPGLEFSLRNLAIIMYDRGDLDSALALFREQEKICRQIEHFDGLQFSLGRQAIILSQQNNLDTALALRKEQEAICRQIGFLEGLHISLDNQAAMMEKQGDLEGALAAYKEAEQLSRQLNKTIALRRILRNQALILERRKDIDPALSVLREEEILCRRADDQKCLSENLNNQERIRQEYRAIRSNAIVQNLQETSNAIKGQSIAYAHPFAPDARWSFSVSRPFRVLQVDQLFSRAIEPVLEQRGIVLECHDASISPESKDFWMNRMKVILELADFQIFFEMHGTPQVEFEAVYSKTVTRKGRAPSLDANFQLKRRNSRIFRPIVISIRNGWGIDHFSAWRGRAVIYCRETTSPEITRERFAKIIDRCMASRTRSILRWSRFEDYIKRRVEGLKPGMMNLGMKMLERQAAKDPSVLKRMGGSIESGREMLKKELANPTMRSTRPKLEIRKTLIRESGLAEIISRNPTALEAYAELKPGEIKKVISENEIETYLHTLRRGEAEFHQGFTETYAQERGKFHTDLEGSMDAIREKIVRAKGEMEAKDVDEGLNELKRIYGKLDGVFGFIGALRYRRRVHHAKGKFHKKPK